MKERVEAIAQSISLSAAMLKHKGVRVIAHLVCSACVLGLLQMFRTFSSCSFARQFAPNTSNNPDLAHRSRKQNASLPSRPVRHNWPRMSKGWVCYRVIPRSFYRTLATLT